MSDKRTRRALWTAPWLIGIVGLGGAVFLLCLGACFGFPCFTTGLRYGLWIDQCPVGDLRLGARVEVSGLVRGDEGRVSVLPQGRFLQGHGSSAWVGASTMYRGAIVTLDLLTDEGEVVGGLGIKGPKKRHGWRDLTVTLPEIPDGDYVLRATVRTRFETIEVDVDLPLYAPALAHLMTDRPLYRPGQEVLLRSVTFKRTDLSPIEGRPGRWRITDPEGNEMLVEKDRAGAWGVADSSFPLDSRAAIGTWTARWETGQASDQVTFEVRPFRLPRFTVEAESAQRWYGAGDTAVVEGTARYTSGAPVAGAPVEVRLRRTEGRWPMPIAWEEPFTTRTDARGAFEVEIGRVPPDLLERNVIGALVRVTEAAGEVAVGATRLVLSEDDLQVEAVTELGDGLVGGFNNRAYLRVATPDGKPLGLADVVVSNPWDPRAEARETTADEDGVVSVQVDPGDPVTVVIPAPPVRIRPMVPDDPVITAGQEALTGRSLDLAERKALDTASRAVARCGDLAPGSAEVRLGVRVSPAGTVTDVLRADGDLGDCVAAAVRGVRFPVGSLRTYAITWRVPDSLVPSFPLSTRVAFGSDAPVRQAWQEAARVARRCVRRDVGVSGSTVITAHWRLREGSRTIETAIDAPTRGTGLDGTQRACVVRAFTAARLADEADGDSLGTVTVTLSVPRPPGTATPQAQTTTGYELKVAASVDGAAIGETNLVLPVGSIPALRLRATPSLAHPGDEVTLEMFRGPDYYGDLPKKVHLMHGTKKVAEAKVDEETRSALFTLPEDRDGFLHVEVGGTRAVIFVQPDDPLAVSVSPGRAAYRPGETATLTVTTRAGDAPTPAGVGLVGVDSALAQLAPLLGPDDQGRVTIRAQADRPAFGAFDPQALALGQVRGENAAKAAVLRISQLPMDPAGDERVYTSDQSVADDEEVLIGHFYRALEALHARVRVWEAEAPEGEVMTPDKMVSMWDGTLRDLRKAGAPAVDGFGRPLTLDLLPSDLLAQVDPRQVVSEGTRLPEDVISWERYVSEEVGR